MLFKKLTPVLIIASLFNTPSLWTKNVIMEFKGAYSLPVNHGFLEAYHNGSALYGPEFTVQLGGSDHWHVFISLDYFQKKGTSIDLFDRTKLRLLPIGIGLKYFIPASTYVDLYVGMGLQVIYAHNKHEHNLVVSKESYSGTGGIGKIGAYCYLPDNWVLDLFFDYSFLRTTKDNFYGPTVIPGQKKVNSAILGGGLGYCF